MATRKYTNRLYDLMVEGVVDPMWLATQLMNTMSEAAVEDFCATELEGFFEEDEDTADEYDEGAEYYGA